jgi:geranylgeranyl diphosphate synthase type II
MKLTMVAGPLACSATGSQIGVLTHCGECLGEAYQVLDDMLDRLPASSRADKTAGQDERHSRTSNYGELGYEGCQSRLATLVQSVRDEITGCFPATEPRHRLLQMLEHLFTGSVA